MRGERAFKELANTLADEDLKLYESSRMFRERFAFRRTYIAWTQS